MTLLNKLALSALLGIVVFNVHAHDNAFCDYLEKTAKFFLPQSKIRLQQNQQQMALT